MWSFVIHGKLGLELEPERHGDEIKKNRTVEYVLGGSSYSGRDDVPQGIRSGGHSI